jgi:hypothetical protein
MVRRVRRGREDTLTEKSLIIVSGRARRFGGDGLGRPQKRVTCGQNVWRWLACGARDFLFSGDLTKKTKVYRIGRRC